MGKLRNTAPIASSANLQQTTWQAFSLSLLPRRSSTAATADGMQKTAMSDDDLMTSKEAAPHLRMSVRTLHRHTKARKINYIKRDGVLLFRRSDLEKFLQKRSLKAA